MNMTLSGLETMVCLMISLWRLLIIWEKRIMMMNGQETTQLMTSHWRLLITLVNRMLMIQNHQGIESGPSVSTIMEA